MTQPDANRAANRLLRAFPPAIHRRVAASLEPVILRRGMVLVGPDAAAEHAYFPDIGLVSLVKIMGDGRTAEVGAVGIEGMVGVGALLGIQTPELEAVVQVEGRGHRIGTSALASEVETSHALKELLLRYMSYRLGQFAQTAACNRLHRLRQRCCRWLLTAHDNVQATTFTLTHEFLALMMGVNRPAVSLTVGALQKRGIVSYRRAEITIHDRSALEDGACECYASLQEHAKRIFVQARVIGRG